MSNFIPRLENSEYPQCGHPGCVEHLGHDGIVAPVPHRVGAGKTGYVLADEIAALADRRPRTTGSDADHWYLLALTLPADEGAQLRDLLAEPVDDALELEPGWERRLVDRAKREGVIPAAPQTEERLMPVHGGERVGRVASRGRERGYSPSPVPTRPPRG